MWHWFRVAFPLLVGTIAGCKGPEEPTSVLSGRVIRPGRTIVDGHHEQLSRIGRVVVSSAGLVAFDQPDAPKLGVVNPRSGQLWRFGRSGGGPGEYPGNPSLAWRGDTLRLAGLQEIDFSPTGELLASMLLSRQLTFRDLIDSAQVLVGSGPVVGVLRDGRYLSELMVRPGSGMTVETATPRGAYAISTRGDSVGVAVVRMPSFPQLGCQGAFCPRYLAAVSPTGDRFAIVGPGPTEHDSAVAALQVFDGTGRPLWSMHLAAPRRLVPQQAIDSADDGLGGRPAQFDVLVGAPGGSGAGAATGGGPAAAREAGAYPVVRRLLLGNDDTIWLQFWDDGRWCALLDDQSFLGCLRLNAHEELRAASRDAIWVAREDEDGIPSILLHEISWDPGHPAR